VDTKPKTSVERPASRWLPTALLAITSTILTVVVLEGAARVALRMQGKGKEAGEVAQYTEYDPVLGWRKRPWARAVYRRREYTVEVAVNRHGLRDPERDYAAPPGTLRLLALGDSFVEAYTVPVSQGVTQVLESSLTREGCPAEVINGGTSGYSTDQELLFYRAEGHLYAPRIVLLFFHYNDVVYNDRQEYFGTPKPVFEMGGGNLRVHRIPVRERPPQATPATAAAEPESSSALVEWIRDRMWYGAPRAYNSVARLGLWPPMPQVPTRLELRVYETRHVAEIEDAWAKTSALLAAAARDTEEHGGRFLVVYAPSRLEVDDGSWQLSRQLYGWDETGWDRHRVAERLNQIGRENGFPVLDLTGPLRRANEGWGPPPYLTYDVHWTRRGHEVAAEEVQRYLAGNGWLEGCPPLRQP
jgi:acetyltransferase AlgX (SGNH hydrolase-like protein)